MATILFQAAGAALGSVFGPLGAVIGRAAGALAGNMLDRALIGGGTTLSGARLSAARLPGAAEGAAIPRLYGTARLGGTLIWATRFEEEATTERTGAKATGTRVKTYRYFANLAVGLCEGEVALVRRVWADGQEIDLTEIEMRFYPGTEDQLPDPLIEAKQGAGNALAYRGLSYVVFERLPLDDYGNRIPLLQFEVIRPVGRLEGMVKAVTVIPGSTEHGYATVQVRERTGEGASRVLNRNTLVAHTDWQASIDELQALCPNLETVALVVSWFGTDLRAGECRVVPGVEVESRNESRDWRVSGVTRAAAYRVSRHDGGPAYGGTPDDRSVVEAIADLKVRGLKVVLYPFVMMDIPHGNGLPDPYGGVEQAANPWRGRITCHPAPGRPGSPDRSAAIPAIVAAFCGTAEAADFDVTGTTVSYQGSDEGYRHMVLHYALLAQAAGGVDAFLIGSELRGLTTLRDAADGFPFVAALADLAADVRAILGAPTKITYGADWSEYFGHHPADGSGDVFFHFDPLWAHPAIDAVGIDNYMPLSDWRDADLENANPDGFRLPDDGQAMAGQIAAGEGFAWYYASEADRAARVRSPISDGAAAKPWVFRFKDIEGWWSNPHFDRVGGVERASPTGWTPGMKPVWFTELGCAAVDKGANQPNVFSDPKSAESALPHFSSGARSDSQQRRFLEAHLGHWQGGAAPAGMVDAGQIFLWTWDARPQPAFPQDLDLWADGTNWRTGHWLNGRLGAGTLADVLAAVLEDHGFADYDVSEVSGDLMGYVQGELASARSLIEPLAESFLIDIVEDGARLKFRSRLAASLPARTVEVLADLEGEPLWRETRGHDSDFAAEASITYFDPASDYGEASARSRRIEAATERQMARDLPAVMAEETALSLAEGMLRDHRIGRRRLELSLGPAELSVQPGDVLSLSEGPEGRFLVGEIDDGLARRLSLREVAAAVSTTPVTEGTGRTPDRPGSVGFEPVVLLVDLPRHAAGDATDFACVAGLTRPWRRLSISSSGDEGAFRPRVTLDRPATIGRLAAPLSGGVSGRFDRSRALEVDLFFGSFSAATELSVLNGENRLALRSRSGAWEVIGFAGAEEISAGRWRLSTLLRGMAGTEDAMAAGADAGAAVVLLDAAVRPLGLTAEETGLSLDYIAEPIGMAASPAALGAFAGGVRAQTPLAPVHLGARRTGGGDVEFSWIRRSRADGDSWLPAEVPLDESAEAYRLEILDGTAVRRVVEVGEARFVYPQALELSDFGGSQVSIRVRVRQLGRVAEGIASEAELVVG
ncbi:MAG: glycoside hydrolase/phage tail family protein [Hydrogenophaga sp.]|nr:glycoside hydrolase/phage tail family protein [Hydrogenophaga sp.]